MKLVVEHAGLERLHLASRPLRRPVGSQPTAFRERRDERVVVVHARAIAPLFEFVVEVLVEERANLGAERFGALAVAEVHQPWPPATRPGVP
jgi:hypothetical protein